MVCLIFVGSRENRVDKLMNDSFLEDEFSCAFNSEVQIVIMENI